MIFSAGRTANYPRLMNAWIMSQPASPREAVFASDIKDNNYGCFHFISSLSYIFHRCPRGCRRVYKTLGVIDPLWLFIT